MHGTLEETKRLSGLNERKKVGDKGEFFIVHSRSSEPPRKYIELTSREHYFSVGVFMGLQMPPCNIVLMIV